MTVLEIGCCGAYCKTCKVFLSKSCAGCKIGYTDGTRKIDKAKCKIKVCCIKNGYQTCADCKDYSNCEIIQSFHNKDSYKYKKYKQAIMFLRDHSYNDFLKIADTWSNQYGKY